MQIANNKRCENIENVCILLLSWALSLLHNSCFGCTNGNNKASLSNPCRNLFVFSVV